MVIIAHDGPASSGCLLLYHRKKMYRFFPPLSAPVEMVNDAFDDNPCVNPLANTEAGGVLPTMYANCTQSLSLKIDGRALSVL